MKLLTRGRVIAALGIIGLGVVLVARGKTSPHPARVGVPHDWSHRQVVFSRPATISQAIRIQKEPRYWQQIARRSAAVRWGGGAPEHGNYPGRMADVSTGGTTAPTCRFSGIGLNRLAAELQRVMPPSRSFRQNTVTSISPTNESCSDYVALSHKRTRGDRNEHRRSRAAQHHCLSEPLRGAGRHRSLSWHRPNDCMGL